MDDTRKMLPMSITVNRVTTSDQDLVAAGIARATIAGSLHDSPGRQPAHRGAHRSKEQTPSGVKLAEGAEIEPGSAQWHKKLVSVKPCARSGLRSARPACCCVLTARHRSTTHYSARKPSSARDRRDRLSARPGTQEAACTAETAGTQGCPVPAPCREESPRVVVNGL